MSYCSTSEGDVSSMTERMDCLRRGEMSKVMPRWCRGMNQEGFMLATQVSRVSWEMVAELRRDLIRDYIRGLVTDWEMRVLRCSVLLQVKIWF